MLNLPITVFRCKLESEIKGKTEQVKTGGEEMGENHTPVMINLLATARYDRMPEVPIQFITVGKLFYRSPKDAQIRYVESQQDEETGEVMNSDICLTFAGDKVTIQRSGEFSNTMVFSNGKRFEGVYQTPYGSMDMAVFTKEAVCRIGDQDGSLHLKYQLQIQGSYTSTTELHLEYHTGKKGKPGKGRTQ